MQEMAVSKVAALLTTGLIVVASTSQAFAQNAAAASSTKGPEVELNGIAPSKKGCMMTFVALNNLAAPINKISFELAFFNDKNGVDRVTVLDFRDLPQGKKRVRQFDMPNMTCENVTRLLINDAPVCDGPAAGECMKGLVIRSKVSVPFEG
ncbi:hypothetical protein QO004_005638 [Rhizobium mesoamericanum]|nr:hypothetical protein [Rhizobium mesoamericanum]